VTPKQARLLLFISLPRLSFAAPRLWGIKGLRWSGAIVPNVPHNYQHTLLINSAVFGADEDVD